MVEKVGRNDPCPCGSGLKYKKCCFLRGGFSEESNLASEALGTIKKEIGENFSGSLDELRDKIQLQQERMNRKSLEDFHGLSAEQMQSVLRSPFEVTGFAKFNPRPHIPQAPYWILMDCLLQELENNPIKATKIGNFNVKFCKATWNHYLENVDIDEWQKRALINSEEKFNDLHCMRLILKISGFLKKRKDQYTLTKKAVETLKKQGREGFFYAMLEAYCREFNWGYQDHYEEDLAIIQRSFLFSLFLLFKAGDKFHTVNSYVDSLVTAFPAIYHEFGPIDPEAHETPQKTIERAYCIRFMESFCWGFGLVELDRPPLFSNESTKVKRAKGLEELLTFRYQG
jgi:hypothetical protein